MGCLVVVADEHEGGLAPAAELAQHRVQGGDGERAAHMPEVACSHASSGLQIFAEPCMHCRCCFAHVLSH